MRLPRKVIISGKIYSVKRNPRHQEGWGSGNTRKRLITIGSKYRNPKLAYETFVHEITELVLLENNLRFNRDTNDEFFYLVKHHELERVTTDIAIAMRGTI